MNKTNIVVSVIIPTYKGSDKIKRSVGSVLAQTYQPTEVIVVDDNGIGTQEQIETQRVLEQYKCCQNFKYIPHEVNKNGSAARNTGLRGASGEYLCFLDDDDEYLPTKIENQVKEFEKLDGSYGMLVGSVKVCEGNYDSMLSGDFKDDFLYEYLCHEVSACSSTVMIRADVLDEVKEWDESFKRHQDWEFFSRVAASFKVKYIEDCGVLKYKYDNNLPKDGKIAEEYRMHYLNKMQHLIARYPHKMQKKIYCNNYIDIGKVYLKNKKIKDAFRLALKTKMPFYALKAYVKDGLKFLQKEKILKR